MSRVENELDALINDTSYDEAPQSRVESILNATINNLEYNAPPGSRIEKQLIELKAIIEQGGGGGTTVTDVVYCTQTEYDTMASHSDSTLYIVTLETEFAQYTVNRRVVTKMYIGNNLLMPKDTSFDVVYENLYCYGGTSSNAMDVSIDTGIDLFSEENINRSFEIRVCVESTFAASSSNEHGVFGMGYSGTGGNHLSLELYSEGGTDLKVYAIRLDGVANSRYINLGNAYGKEIIFRKADNLISIYVDDVLVDTLTFTPATTETYNLMVGNYRSYSWAGVIKYFKFKYLD